MKKKNAYYWIQITLGNVDNETTKVRSNALKHF